MSNGLDAIATLWPESQAGWSRRRDANRRRMIALPDTAQARQLMPWRWSTLPATVSRTSDDLSAMKRWRNALGIVGLLTVGAVPVRRRFTVDDERSVAHDIATRLGASDTYSIALCGPPRANQKPVLQLHDGRGRTHAFVKVAWSDLTRRLLDAEQAALDHLASTPRGFDVPAVSARGSHEGLDWLALTPVGVRARQQPSTDGADHLARLVEATGASPNDDEAMARYVDLLRAESAGLEHTSEAIAGLTDRWASRSLRCGASHGDFVPWNMLSGRPESAVWDWERYRRDAPLGFDRLHFRTQTGIRGDRAPLTSVLRGIATRLDDVLSDVAESDRAAHFDWYVADLLSRYERDALDDPSERLPARVLDLHQILKERLESP